MNWNRRDWILLSVLTALGALLRLYHLGIVPPGFQFDEAYNAIDADLVLHGNLSIFLPANGGREALYTYWQAALIALLGMDVFTLRLASAIFGILAIPVSYLLVRRLISQDSQLVAAFTALVLTISVWHIHFSRFGIRVIMMPVLLSAVFGFFWLGANATTRNRRLWSYVAAGFFLGLTPWTHPTGRLIPLVLLLYVIWIWWRDPAQRRWTADSPAGGLVISGAVAFLVFLPLGVEFVRHPEFFFSHASEVSIFAERVSGDSVAWAFWNNFLHVVGMFSVFGHLEWTHGPVQRPVFDPLLSIPFYIGLVIWVLRLRRRDDPDFQGLSILGLWALAMLLPSLLSDGAPNYSRTLPSLPATFVAAGLGLTWIFTQPRLQPWLGPVAAVAILGYSASQAVIDYFVDFPHNEEVYYLYDADKLDALTYLSGLTDDYAVYLSQLWGERHSTIYFLRGDSDVGSLDTSDTVVLPPPGKGAVYAFPPEQANRADRLMTVWPEDAVREEHTDDFGAPLLSLVTISAETGAQWPPELAPQQETQARFFEAPTLLGMATVPNESQVILFWREDVETLRDLTTFVHLMDADGQRVGQVDKLPGNGSYRTPYWAMGERVIDRYYPDISDPCAYGDRVRVQVGWYEYLGDGRRMARTDAPGDTALAGEMTLPFRSVPAADLQPATPAVTAFAAGAGLLGYTLHQAELQPGAPLTLDLVWQGQAEDGVLPLALALQDGGVATPLWDGQLAPNAGWREGEVLCRRVRTQIPPELEPGRYDLLVTLGDSGPQAGPAPVGTLEIQESTRAFVAPPLAETLDVTLGQSIALLGLAAAPAVADGMLQVTPVWQALPTPPGEARRNYTVFVHLADARGAIVAQSDAEPAQGYGTAGWLAGEVVVDAHSLPVADLPPGEYTLRLGLYDPLADGARLPAVDADGRPLPDDQVLLDVSLSGDDG